jgi:hypothetical protein
MFVGSMRQRSKRNWMRGLLEDGDVISSKSVQASNNVKPTDSAIEIDVNEPRG